MQRAFAEIHRLFRRCFYLLLWPFACIVLASENIILFLQHWTAIRSASFVTQLWVWSFGHQASDLHVLWLRFRGEKLLVLFHDYGGLNHPLLDTFRGVMDVQFLRHSPLGRWCWKGVLGVPLTQRLHAFLLRSVLLGSRITYIPEFFTRHRPRVEGVYVTEQFELLRNCAPPVFLSPPDEHIETFSRLLQERFPDLAKRWFVALYLRRKQRNRPDIRDTSPFSYQVVLERVREAGGFVLCGGDYDPHRVFPEEEGVLGYSDFPCAREMCDVFFLSQCRLLVCGHSGTVPVATLYGMPMLLTNCGLFYLSGMLKNHLVSYKKLKDKNARVLSARETFSFPIVGYSEEHEFRRAGLTPLDHTRDELALLIDEALARLVFHTWETPPDQEALERKFRSLVPPNSWAAVSPASPAYHYLRSLRWE